MRSDTFDPETQVFEFSHIPKCGGTTVHHFLEQLMDGKYTHCFPGSGWEDRMPDVWGAGGHQLRGQNPISTRDEKEVVRLIIMREPLQRFMSFYRHMKDNPGHYLAKRASAHISSALDFARYCETHQISEFINLQSQFVVGHGGDHNNIDEVLTTFNAEFDFYAPLEMLSVLRILLSDFFGKEPPALVSRNISKPFELPAAERKAVADVVYRNNANDLQLYLECNKRFMEFLAQRANLLAADAS